MNHAISAVVFLFANPLAVSICEGFISMSIFTELTEERWLDLIKYSDCDRYFAVFPPSTRDYTSPNPATSPM